MTLPDTEYSEIFDEYRKNRVATSFHKYGTAKKNYGYKLSNALENLELCINKYKETHNTEYLCDAANYCMFEFMYPQFDNAYFKPTDSKDSAGIVGFCIKDVEDIE